MSTRVWQTNKNLYKESQLKALNGEKELSPMISNIQHVLISHKFHYFIIGLVIFDVLLVMTDLGLWLTHSEFHADHDTEHALHILKLISLSILCAFELEFFLCIFAFGLKWLCQIGHFIDFFVVTFSLIFDIIEHNEDHFEVAEVVALLVIARLWRIARIGHAFGETALFEMELLEEEYDLKIMEKDNEIKELRNILEIHKIEVPKSINNTNTKEVEMQAITLKNEEDNQSRV